MPTRLLIAVCIACFFSSSLLAQGGSSALQSQPMEVLQKENADGQTLPPVNVYPPNQTNSSANPLGNYQSPYQFPTGGISWNSDQIYSDQQLVGPYNQPQWTTQRPWATTRVYVLPPGQAQVEQWVRPTYPRGGKPKFRFLEEFAIGLPGRFQLDLYERWNVEPNGANREYADHEGTQIELRWAMADWGDIWMNPTLYAEWVEKGGPQDKPNVYEVKLLLGDQIGDNLYYATNIVLEQETGGEREQEIAWSHALSMTLIDRLLLGGLEANFTNTTVHSDRGRADTGFTIGPSLQLRPTNRTFVDVVGLFGVTNESPDAQLYVIFGYQFGTRAGPSVPGPRSTIGN